MAAGGECGGPGTPGRAAATPAQLAHLLHLRKKPCLAYAELVCTHTGEPWEKDWCLLDRDFQPHHSLGLFILAFLFARKT